ncbi:response regulator transcription factor, partial [Arthrobacter deserti]|nr:response regulator transcription factor [Arthrobacter deserti]
MVNVLVVDDELPAVEALAYLLARDERVGSIHKAASGAEALRALENHDVDALFLDIHMPALSGLDIARVISRFSRPPAVVFVTADEDKAVQAFELAAVGYLLKPVRAERLAGSVRRICELLDDRMARGEGAEPAARPEVISVDQGGVTKMIRRDDIRYVQAQGDYARLHTAESSYLIRVPLNDLERQWAQAGYLRIHR